jgi:hypothetical protein
MITKSIVVAAMIATTALASPALAQSRTHTGSVLPNYYSPTGKQQWGGWEPPQIAASSAKPLYASARLTSREHRFGSNRQH